MLWILNFFVALEISAELPPEEELERWCGEPVKAAILPTSLFLTNKKGMRVIRGNKRLMFLYHSCLVFYNCGHFNF